MTEVRPLKLKDSKEYCIRLSDEDWSTLAAMMEVRRRQSWYSREIDNLGDAIGAIVRERQDGAVWLRGRELHWIGAMNISGHRYTDDLLRIRQGIRSQLEK